MKHKRLLLIVALGFLLRIVAVGRYPVGLYSDEAAFGYNAYLLLTTGHDEYGRFWPMSLESFGDWKPPMQAWLAIPFVAIFGLSEVAVRLPSVLLGTITIIIVYLLAVEFFPGKRSLGEIAAFFLALSPWHIFMSRTAMLVGIEVFFVSVGVLGLLKGLKNSRWWIVSAMSFAGAVYSYYGSRVTIPLLLLAFSFCFWNDLKKKMRSLIFPVIVGGLFVSPLLVAAVRQPLILTGRARTTSVFFNDNVRLQLWAAHTKAGLVHVPPAVSRIFDNKLYYYSRDIVGRWASHFSPEFLFFRGDIYPPFTLAHMGVIFLVDLPFFLLGILVVRSQLSKGDPRRRSMFLLLYLLLAPFVASLTFMTPAANRSFNLVIPWTVITAIGMSVAIERLRTLKQFGGFIKVGIAIFYGISLFIFTTSYLWWTPQEMPREWHYGRRALVTKLGALLPQFRDVVMSNNGGPPYIFLAFYLKIPYEQFMNAVHRDPIIDELGWGHVDYFLNVTIPRHFEWGTAPKIPQGLYVGFEEELDHHDVTVVDRVYYPNDQIAYELGTLKQ